MFSFIGKKLSVKPPSLHHKLSPAADRDVLPNIDLASATSRNCGTPPFLRNNRILRVRSLFLAYSSKAVKQYFPLKHACQVPLSDELRVMIEYE